MKNYQYAEDISREINKKIKALELYNSQTSQKGNTSDFIGEKAKFLIGSSELNSKILYEIEHKGKIVKSEWITLKWRSNLEVAR